MIIRIIASLVILVSILFLPSWFYISILFLAIAIFPFFWEGIIFALLIEVLYGTGIRPITAFISPLAILVLVTLIVLIPFRERIRLYV